MHAGSYAAAQGCMLQVRAVQCYELMGMATESLHALTCWQASNDELTVNGEYDV